MPSSADVYFEAIESKKPFPLDKTINNFFLSSTKYPLQNINVEQKKIPVNQSYRKFSVDIIWSVLLVLFAFLGLFLLLCYVLEVVLI